jgi:ATP:cob(I)alamin adenosyltransferase
MMTRIYTKTGDAGETGLYGGSRIGKDSLTVECYGNLDELGSMLGMAYAMSRCEDVRTVIRQIQNRLFVMGAELASDARGLDMLPDRISATDIAYLESQIDRFQDMVLQQTSFVIPGGSAASSAIHVARTIARRLERSMVRASMEKPVSDILGVFVNRLSDMLYILARAEEEDTLVQTIKNRVLERLNMKKSNENQALSFWKRMADAAEKKASELGIGIVFAAVDQGGNLALLHRTDESLLASIDIAANKAYTALILKMPSDQVGELALPGQMLYGIGTTNNGRIVTFGGGFPVEKNGEIIGAIGVSGGSVSQDMEIATCALKTVQ